MILSKIGNKLTKKTGVLELMEDLAAASLGEATGQRLLKLGGGNPAHIPVMENIWRKRFREISESEDFNQLIQSYDSADGRMVFRSVLADRYKRDFGWPLTAENIAVTNGSQIASFYLLNLFCGDDGQGGRRRVLYPLMPEYVGYADQILDEDSILCCKPRIELLGERYFKYYIDFNAVEDILKREGPSIGAIFVSRPTNPSGNVLTDSELESLAALSERFNIPFILDTAYGKPFPGIDFVDSKPFWRENVILLQSLSKIGLPSLRTGIVVAKPEIIAALTAVNAIASLATNTIGQAIVEPLIASGELFSLSRDTIEPFYRKRRGLVLELTERLFSALPLRIHRSEGAIFLWFWFDKMPISARDLYLRLKRRSVQVLPGEYFCFGRFNDGASAETWDQPASCLRINYSGEEEAVIKGLELIAEETTAAYAKG